MDINTIAGLDLARASTGLTDGGAIDVVLAGALDAGSR